VGEPPPGSPAQEAERLVVSALAAVSLATKGWLAGRPEGHRVATGADECCACPVCRTLTVLADPSPELVERIATGAAEVATGVTSVLRAFSDAFTRPTDADPTDPGPTEPDTGPTEPDTGPTEPDTGPVDAGAGPQGRGGAAPEWGDSSDIPPQPGPDAGKVAAHSAHKVVPPADPAAPTSIDNGDAAS
jgi:hypothetical protein